MSKYSLQYRSARRRAFGSGSLSQKPVSKATSLTSNTASKAYWESASFVGFDPESGRYMVRTLGGEVKGSDRIPGNGAEFGGVSIGTGGLFSQGFWSD
jgi:hypothetical protein